MNYSENYGFALPEDGDFYDIAPISENFDAIDTILAENEGQMTAISEKIGTPATQGQTVFSLLENNSGGSIIRSIQYKTLSLPVNSSAKDIAINPVNLEKTIVIYEVLEEGCEFRSKITYALTANNIRVTPSGHACTVGFWVIEFN